MNTVKCFHVLSRRFLWKSDLIWLRLCRRSVPVQLHVRGETREHVCLQSPGCLRTLTPNLDLGSEQRGLGKLVWLSPRVPVGSSLQDAWWCYRGANYSKLVWDECEHLLNICFFPAAVKFSSVPQHPSWSRHVIKQPTSSTQHTASRLFIFQFGFLIPLIRS